MSNLPPEVQEKMTEIKHQLITETLFPKGLSHPRVKGSNLYYEDSTAGRGGALRAAQIVFVTEVAEESPIIADIILKLTHMREIHRKKEALMEELLFTAALKVKAEKELQG